MKALVEREGVESFQSHSKYQTRVVQPFYEHILETRNTGPIGDQKVFATALYVYATFQCPLKPNKYTCTNTNTLVVRCIGSSVTGEHSNECPLHCASGRS